MCSRRLGPKFDILKNWPSQFDEFSALTNQLKIRIATNCNIVSYKKNQLIFNLAESPQKMLFILNGTAHISKGIFDQLVMTSTPFRDLVFATYTKSFSNLFLLIDEIAFQRVDVRLAKKLISMSKTCNIVNITHQGLATELGTAREVISRELKEFQMHGWITQSRGKITVVKADKLSAFYL